jgi:ParB-like chromosome segregation protein Spo0J
VKTSQTDLSPSRIDASENNPNRMEPERFAALVETIKRFGFLQPVLVRPNPKDKRRFIACDGHHRIRAAQEAGLASIPAIVGNMTEEEANALQVAMNRLRGELDLSATATILDSLHEAGWGAADLGSLGFSLEEVGDLLASLSSDPDIMPESIEGPEDPVPTPSFVLELEFESAEQMRVAKRALRRAAGKGQLLSHGLLRLLVEE